MDGLGLDDGFYDLITLHNGTVMQIHGPGRCVGPACCFHAPSQHPLMDAPMIWMKSFNLMMRVCRHGSPHPDPDSLRWVQWAGMHYDGWHPCCEDRCCEAGATVLGEYEDD